MQTRNDFLAGVLRKDRNKVEEIFIYMEITTAQAAEGELYIGEFLLPERKQLLCTGYTIITDGKYEPKFWLTKLNRKNEVLSNNDGGRSEYNFLMDKITVQTDAETTCYAILSGYYVKLDTLTKR